jgi:hypothetical protein
MLNNLNMRAFFISGLKIIGHGNPDNNLESHCTPTAQFLTSRKATEHFLVFELDKNRI